MVTLTFDLSWDPFPEYHCIPHLQLILILSITKFLLDVYKRQVHRRSAPNVLVQGQTDEKNRVYFTGENNKNPIEFLLTCEREMARVGSRLDDQDRICLLYTSRCV